MTRTARTITAAVLLATAAGCSTSRVGHPAPNDAPRDAVILLHGLARTSRSMDRMAQALADAGYAVYALAYPSREKSVERISEEDLGPLIAQVQTTEHQRIHFVAHSLGYFIGSEWMYGVLEHGLADLKKPQVALAAKLGWGLFYGLGFGAGIGAAFHHAQRDGRSNHDATSTNEPS